MNFEVKMLKTDILIIGGGTAGCFAAIAIAEKAPNVNVLIAEKANIKRSGCLAAGVNALNAYITEGETPETYLQYVKEDYENIVREDLVYTMALRLNEVTKKIEDMGLVILKDPNGKYLARGKRNIKINGENIKPILAKAVESKRNIKVLNHVNIIDYIIKNNRAIGAYGFSINTNIFYIIIAKAVICATGGAAGLYRPNNPGFSRHKMWYPPFNVGSGYAMGIRAGCEMTSYEVRFIALRCKDTLAPTGTIAQEVGAEFVNSKGEYYERKYGRPTTYNRVFSTVEEMKAGRGPCYLKTMGISKEDEQRLTKAYLHMAPSQTLKWIDSGKGPSVEDVEIEGSEPYIVGGHSASGYWVDTKRQTTLKGLFAAGDVVGGCPHKYVTGCFAEAEIAANSALEYIKDKDFETLDISMVEQKLNEVQKFFKNAPSLYTTEELEEAMQKVMDTYAGGISTGYAYNSKGLEIAKEKIEKLFDLAQNLRAEDPYQLMQIYELIDRLYVCKVLLHHLEARKETRWRAFQEFVDYPYKDDENFLKYVNSRFEDGEVKIIFRSLVKKDEVYEHKD